MLAEAHTTTAFAGPTTFSDPTATHSGFLAPFTYVARHVAFERSVPRLHRALVNKLYVDDIYDVVVVRTVWRGAKMLWRVVDAALIDGLFVNGSAQLVSAVSALGRRFQNGNVQRY